MNADNTEPRAPVRLVMAVDEGTYSALWYEPPDQRQPLTPRIFPPPARGKKPKVIPYQTMIHAERLSAWPLGDGYPEPRVASREERFLRSANSPTLGPNAYLFCGPVIAADQWGEGRDWHSVFIVDCGVPLIFGHEFRHHGDDDGTLENWARQGAWLHGIVKLTTGGVGPRRVGEGWGGGLFQTVTGHVKGMQVLDLDPASRTFGKVRRVPFGHRPSVDPDFVLHQSVWVVLDVVGVSPLRYAAFPWRPAECPEPDIPGLVRTSGVDESISWG